MLVYMRFLNIVVALSVVGPAHAQGSYSNPGPPPEKAAEVPTLAQAKSFVERMVQQNSVVACTFEHSEISTSREHKYSIIINDNFFSFADHETSKSIDKTGEIGRIVRSETHQFNISDIDTIVVSNSVPNSRPQCDFPTIITMRCKLDGCVNGRSENISTVYGKIDHSYKSTLKRNWVYFGVNSKSMAERIAHALRFYKSGIKEVSAEPF